jgi:ribosomal protein L24
MKKGLRKEIKRGKIKGKKGRIIHAFRLKNEVINQGKQIGKK